MKKLFNRLSDNQILGLAAAGLIMAGTALNTAWSAAVFPDKQDHKAYMQEIKTEAIGGAIGSAIAALGGLLAVAGIRRMP